MTYTRRKLLTHLGIAGAGVMLTPYERFANGLIDSLIRKAYAEEVNLVPGRYYVNVFFPGAPARVVFDQWMRTNSSDPTLNSNPMVSTAYKKSGGAFSGLEYRTTEKNGILVPHLFSQSVNTSKGSRNLTEVLDHMLCVRGFATGLDGHQLNLTKQMAPVGGIPSLGALATDAANRPFETVQYPNRGSYSVFSSNAGKAINVVDGAKPLGVLFEGLLPSAADLQKANNLKQRNLAAFDRANAQLKALSQTDALGAKTLKASLENARTLLKNGVGGDIDSYWGPAVARYKNVINTAAQTIGIDGISDMAVTPDPSAGRQWQIHLTSSNFILSKDQDLRNAAKTATINAYAESLALTEYMLLGDFASSMEVHMDASIYLEGLMSTDGVKFNGGLISDMHETGAGPALIFMNCFYRGILAGILELKDQLSQKQSDSGTVWNDTVVHFVGDFTRISRLDGSGADHGFNQLATSVVTGAFNNGPFVVGNIDRGAATGGYGGTVGTAAPIAGYNVPGLPSPAFAASQVSQLLKLPQNPYGNVSNPVVALNGNSLSYINSGFKGKLVGG